MNKQWGAPEWVEWTYERDEGDIVVYAPTKQEALAMMKQHGFIQLDPDRIKRTGPTMSERMKATNEGLH